MKKVIKAIPKENFCLFLEFSDGKKGIFDAKPYINKGFFKELKDENYFKRARLAFDTVAWPNEQDFAPETLYEEIRGPIFRGLCFVKIQDKREVAQITCRTQYSVSPCVSVTNCF